MPIEPHKENTPTDEPNSAGQGGEQADDAAAPDRAAGRLESY
ncbi:hypothetical protein ACFP3U_15925 [Kitasatospora misakiensis]|uniref:Uncharacterized protein n=1 Tax=Kitasatospora misakiensis TaxID=67330 RepID=A0ABW0X1R6_9ACTN